MKPTIGRIVIFKDHSTGTESPAIVVNIRDTGTVDLNVFCNEIVETRLGTFARVLYAGNVPENDPVPGNRESWHWPPRV